jgi:hypothetical protein
VQAFTPLPLLRGGSLGSKGSLLRVLLLLHQPSSIPHSPSPEALLAASETSGTAADLENLLLPTTEGRLNGCRLNTGPPTFSEEGLLEEMKEDL